MEYTKLLEAYIHKNKVKQAKNSYKRRSTKNSTKNSNFFHSTNNYKNDKPEFKKSKNMYNSEKSASKNTETEDNKTKEQIPQQKYNQQRNTKNTTSKKYKNLDDAKQWDSYNFFEPSKTTDNLEKRTLKRKRPQTTLRKILKKIYFRLLLKLHPDRSPFENSEKICKRLWFSWRWVIC